MMCATTLVIAAPIRVPLACKSNFQKKVVPRCEFCAFATAGHNCERFLNAHSPGVCIMSRTVRLKVEPAPTRRETGAQWTGARDFKRHVRYVSQPGRDQAPDLLSRLEREVGPLADALTRAKPRSVLLRALLRTAIAGTALAALVIAWQHIPSDAWNTETTGRRMISEAEDVARLRAALVESEAEHRQLQLWHEDSNLLLYRSPWRPR
jgi:hypothetical protein